MISDFCWIVKPVTSKQPLNVLGRSLPDIVAHALFCLNRNKKGRRHFTLYAVGEDNHIYPIEAYFPDDNKRDRYLVHQQFARLRALGYSLHRQGRVAVLTKPGAPDIDPKHLED